MSVTPDYPKPRKLSDLKASILNPALTSHFECWFNLPGNVNAGNPGGVRSWVKQKSNSGLGIPYDGNERFFSLSCSEASLPGSSLATHELNNDHTGVTERHAYRRQYDTTASFTFYVDHDYNIVYLFENWISYIVNEQLANGLETESFFYRVNFPKNYQTTLHINKFERDYSGRMLQYKFLNAYPISIDSMPISYESSQILKCTVGFNYSRYVVGADLNIRPTTTEPEIGVGVNDLPTNQTSTSPIG